MDSLSADIFIIPTIALMIAVGLFILFYTRSDDKHSYNHFVMYVLIISMLLNSVWELAHSPFYYEHQYDWQHISICLLASLADTVMVFILLFLFGLIYKDIFWIRNLSTGRVAILLLVGAIGAIIGEMWHISRGDWLYADSMPLIPIIGVGILPVLQFTILPLIIFIVSRKLSNRRTFVTIK